MKTIAYVLADFPVLSETFVGNEIRAVAALGHTVAPIIMRRSAGPAQQEDIRLAARSIHLDRLPRRPSARGLSVLPSRLRNALRYVWRQRGLDKRSLLFNAMRIGDAARSIGATHLHAHFAGGAAAHAIVAADLIGASVSFVCHGHDVYAEPMDLGLKLEHAHFAVAVCQDMADDLKRMAPQSRIEHVTCGTDASRFSGKGSSRNGRLLFVGRLVEQKGLYDLLDALASLPRGDRLPLDVVGQGPLLGSLQARAAALGLTEHGDVCFLGPRQSSWVQEEGPCYEALVAPFKEAPDGSRDSGPLVVKEAMCMQLPVISTRFMGVKETVTPDTGLLVEPGDVGELAQAIGAFCALDRQARRGMGQAGRRRAETYFTLDVQARKLSRLFETASSGLAK